MPWRDRIYDRLNPLFARELKRLDRREAAELEEIRVRVHRPLEMVFSHERRQIDTIPDEKEMDELVAALCGYARYACEKQLAQGYITLPGGHRAGVCGKIVSEKGVMLRMSGITSVCIRVAKHIRGASIPVRPFLCRRGVPNRVLLLGPPGCGKTTVLRDAGIYLSDECGFHVAAADERDEIYAAPGLDAGARLDVVCGIGKAKAMVQLMRSMSPEVILTDEIGRMEDADVLMDAVRCGIGVLASAHAGEMEDVHRRPILSKLIESGAFDWYILLGKHGKLLRACDRDGNEHGQSEVGVC